VDASRLVRPALTLVIFAAVGVIAYDLAAAESREADEFGRALAGQMKASCDRDARCPSAPPGWTPDDHGRSRAMRNQNRVEYRVLPDGSAFRVTVHHALERMRDIEGGVGKPLTEREVIR
jgi:hypothetical protein